MSLSSTLNASQGLANTANQKQTQKSEANFFHKIDVLTGELK